MGNGLINGLADDSKLQVITALSLVSTLYKSVAHAVFSVSLDVSW
jgi:hypothetical protein